MNTKEQLEIVARYAGWEYDGLYYFDPTEINAVPGYFDADDIETNKPRSYHALMPVWQKVREELAAIRNDDFLPISYAAIDRLIECKTALTDGTLSDFLLSLSNAILWIESNKQK